MNNITEKEAFARMAAYCSSSEHCRAEVYEKLKKWELESDVINRILNALETEKYIDDERYCRSFVHDKFRFAKWGKVKIAQALYLKKIPSDTAWRHLNNLDEDEYLNILQALLKTKQKSIRAKDDYECTGKLIRFALGRGFEMKDIKRCLTLSDDMEYAE